MTAGRWWATKTWKPYLGIHNRFKDSKIHLEFNTTFILLHHKLTSSQLLPLSSITTKKARNIYFLKSTASTRITQAANTNFNKPSSFSIILHFKWTSSVLAVCTIAATSTVPTNPVSTMTLSCCLDASASMNADVDAKTCRCAEHAVSQKDLLDGASSEIRLVSTQG